MHLTVCYYHVTYGFQSDSIFFSLPEYQGILCLKQVPYLKFKLQQRHSHPKPPKAETNTQPFTETGQLIELSCEHLSVRYIWLHVIIMSRTSFRVYQHSILYLNSKELLARSRGHIWSLNESNESRTQNHLVSKRTLNDLAKLVKWLSCFMCGDMYCEFNCMLLSCHVRVSEWIDTL